MANLFDTAHFPTTEPAALVAGDRWTWKRTDLTDYPPASYALEYHARLEGDAFTTFKITASASGNDHLITVGQETTAPYLPGRYQWQSYIIRSSDNERITLDTGVFTVTADLAKSINDPRSDARKGLNAVTAVLNGRASKDQEAYSINNRSLSRTPLPDLIALKKHFQAEVNREDRKMGRSGKILSRFNGC